MRSLSSRTSIGKHLQPSSLIFTRFTPLRSEATRVTSKTTLRSGSPALPSPPKTLTHIAPLPLLSLRTTPPKNLINGPSKKQNKKMAANLNGANGTGDDAFTVKAGLAQMLKGGVIMDVTTAAEARIAEEAGACAVMALERIPSDIRAMGGVARMSNPQMIKDIQAAVTIPVMAKARIGHVVECQILEALGVDYVDESEVLTPADNQYHVQKSDFTIPFVCGCRNLGEALRRITEGAAMIRTKGEAGTGDVVEAVKHMRTVNAEIARARAALNDGGPLAVALMARELGCDAALLQRTAELGRLPVVNFAAGGVATPADAALMMHLGCDGVFVGSGIFKDAETPEHAARRARAIVKAVANYKDSKALIEASIEHGEAMKGISNADLKPEEKMSGRGW